MQGASALEAIQSLVSHLEEVCAVSQTTERTGCEVVGADLMPKKPLSAHLDKRSLIRRKAGAHYLDVVLDSFRIWGLFSTSANFSMVMTKLVHYLGLVTKPFDKMFALANGVVRKFVGCLPEVKLQLHDNLEVTMRNVRVLDAKYAGLLLGTDVFTETGNGALALVSVARDGQEVHLTVEVQDKGKGTGLRVAVPLHRQVVPAE